MLIIYCYANNTNKIMHALYNYVSTNNLIILTYLFIHLQWAYTTSFYSNTFINDKKTWFISNN